MSEVERFEIEVTGSNQYRHVKVPFGGSYVSYRDYEALQQKLDAVLAGLDKLAGEMLGRSLDSVGKQSVAYAECAHMLAKRAAHPRAETDTTSSQYESLAGGK